MTEKHRVAVVVFTTVDAVDKLDATHIAERCVHRAILAHDTQPDRDGVTLTAKLGGTGRRIEAIATAVREVGMAMRNGYLWAMPTSEGYPREDDE